MKRLITASNDMLIAGDAKFRCASGKGGRRLAHEKLEGDGASPIGVWPLRRVFYRGDRHAAPKTGLPCVPLRPHDGWCDASDDPLYNRPISLPYPASHECLWREDDIYDIIVELGHNDTPPIAGRGSAIFMHVARDAYQSTEGCIALALEDLLTVLAQADQDTVLEIKS